MTLTRKRALALFVAGLAGAAAVLPYALASLPAIDLPLPVVVVSSLVNSAIFIAIAVALGTWSAPRTDLRTPIIDSALSGGPIVAGVRAVSPIAIAMGVVSGVAIIVVDLLVFRPLVPELRALPPSATPPPWMGLLATLYGALTEEILLRFGLMSLFAWLLGRITRGPAAYWIAIFAAAILFGLGHLPATAQILPLTPLVITRAVVLNGLVGIVTGWLYWRRGLEAGMIAHGAADLVLHVVLPAVASV